MPPRLHPTTALRGLRQSHHHQRPTLPIPANRAFTQPPAAFTFKKKRARRSRRDLAHTLGPYVAAPTLPPPYPYEQTQKLYKQSSTGLYGGLRIRFGNTVSERHEVKTRRTWRPNIVHKKLYSLALARPLKLRVATRVLRTIDKAGGLDEYLLGGKPARLKELGEEGWRLRWAVLQALRDSERVTRNPCLVKELQSGLPREQVPDDATVAVPRFRTRDTRVDSEDMDDGDRDGARLTPTELAERVQRRLNESTHMREEPSDSTLLQQIGKTISRPFAGLRRMFGRR